VKYSDERGYVILAFNTENSDYVACAITLAKSIRFYHPDVKICLITGDTIENDIFDYVKVVDDLGGYKNDLHAFTHTPFHETIKLEADMILTSPFDHWWTYFRNWDIWISTGCRTYHDRWAPSRHYRKIIDDNQLPDVYNACTYWRQSQQSRQFYLHLSMLFNNWSSVQNSLLFARDEPLNTDLAYAVIAGMFGEELYTGPGGPQIVHMKPKINHLTVDEWNKQLVWEMISGQVRINGHTQNGLLHYHLKDLAKEFGESYG
jgi:hypothetical protein